MIFLNGEAYGVGSGDSNFHVLLFNTGTQPKRSLALVGSAQQGFDLGGAEVTGVDADEGNFWGHGLPRFARNDGWGHGLLRFGRNDGWGHGLLRFARNDGWGHGLLRFGRNDES
jgi:hypothetical protein